VNAVSKALAGATRVSDLAGAIPIRAEEASIVTELRAGSEDAYAWLITHYHQPVYSLVYRIIHDPADAADTTQEVFLKVFRGIGNFNGEASLKTWIYRIAIHEASNQKRWWFRHKRKECTIEAADPASDENEHSIGLKDTLADENDSPFDCYAHEEVRARVEAELKEIAEPFRTTLVLRDIEGLSYEEIAEVLQVSLGTVKSRLTRGRDALRDRLLPFVKQAGEELGLRQPRKKELAHSQVRGAGQMEAERR
jgi:RNA polymerase sigma-70 factor (ECF subfamily)